MNFDEKIKDKEYYLYLAETIAYMAHANQVDKGGTAYIEHPQNVAMSLKNEDEKTVAWLHDVCEDTSVTLNELAAYGFPEHILEAIRTITKPKNMNYFKYIKLVKQNSLAAAVKIADLKQNMRLDRLKEVTEKDYERNKKYKKALSILLDER